MRQIAIWLLHYYSDNRQPVPSWLQRWIDRDPVLFEYRNRLQQLERTLSLHPLEASCQDKAPVDVRTQVSGRRVAPGGAIPWLGWGAALAAIVLVIVSSVAVWNGAKNDGLEVALVQPKAVQTPVPQRDIPWQDGAKKATAWALRSLQARREASRTIASSLDGQLDREILAWRQQMKDATRYVAVKLPVASLKLLGIPR